MKMPKQKDCRIDVKNNNGSFTSYLIECNTDSLIFWSRGAKTLTELYKDFKYYARNYSISLWVPYNYKPMTKIESLNYCNYSQH